MRLVSVMMILVVISCEWFVDCMVCVISMSVVSVFVIIFYWMVGGIMIVVKLLLMVIVCGVMNCLVIVESDWLLMLMMVCLFILGSMIRKNLN